MQVSNHKSIWAVLLLIFVVALAIVRESPTFYPTLAASSRQQCPVYQCDYNGALDTSDQCMQQDKLNLFQINVKDCGEGMMCHSGLNRCNEDPYFKVEGRSNGAVCDLDFMCQSDHCLENTCQGEVLGAFCEYDSDCNPNLFCGEGVCVHQKKEFEQCVADTECENNMGCSNGVCLKYGSQVDYEVSDNALTCQSGFVGPYHYQQVCLPTPEIVNVLGPDYKCSSGQSSCHYQSLIDGDDQIETFSFDLDCQCGFSSSGSSFCPSVFRSDYTSLLAQVTQKYGLGCHTLDRLDIYECLMRHAREEEGAEGDLSLLNEFIVQHYERERNNEVQENDSCMQKNSKTSQYWDAKSQRPMRENLHQQMRSSGTKILSNPSFYGLMFLYFVILVVSYTQ